MTIAAQCCGRGQLVQHSGAAIAGHDSAYILQMSTDSLSLCFGGQSDFTFNLQSFQLG